MNLSPTDGCSTVMLKVDGWIGFDCVWMSPGRVRYRSTYGANIEFYSNNPHKSCWCPFGAMDSILPKSALQRIHSGCNPRLWQFELSNLKFPNLGHQLFILKNHLQKNRQALQQQQQTLTHIEPLDES